VPHSSSIPGNIFFFYSILYYHHCFSLMPPKKKSPPARSNVSGSVASTGLSLSSLTCSTILTSTSTSKFEEFQQLLKQLEVTQKVRQHFFQDSFSLFNLSFSGIGRHSESFKSIPHRCQQASIWKCSTQGQDFWTTQEKKGVGSDSQRSNCKRSGPAWAVFWFILLSISWDSGLLFTSPKISVAAVQLRSTQLRLCGYVSRIAGEPSETVLLQNDSTWLWLAPD